MNAERALAAGEVILLDTDSVPGLHVRADHPEAASRLAACKGSPADRPFLLLFASTEEVWRYGAPATAEQRRRLERAWPGPVTALLRPTDQAPPAWALLGRSLAARVPDHADLRALIQRIGAPLFSTSANRAGEAPATTLEQAAARFPDLPVLDLGGRAVGRPSTLVDLTVEEAVVLREGAVPWPPAPAP